MCKCILHWPILYEKYLCVSEVCITKIEIYFNLITPFILTTHPFPDITLTWWWFPSFRFISIQPPSAAFSWEAASTTSLAMCDAKWEDKKNQIIKLFNISAWPFNRQIIQFEFPPTWSCVSLTRSTTSYEWKLFRLDKMKVNSFQILSYLICGTQCANKK